MKKPPRKIVPMIGQKEVPAKPMANSRGTDKIGENQREDRLQDFPVDELRAKHAAEDSRQVEDDRSHQRVLKRQSSLAQQQWNPVNEEVDEHQAHEERKTEKHAADCKAVAK